MAEPQPPTIVEGATTGDVEDEVQAAKSAEDRKAQAAMSRLDARDDDAAGSAVDKDAASKAMKSLGGASNGEKKEVKKVKVEAADVTLLVRLLCSSAPVTLSVLMTRAWRRSTNWTLLSPRPPICSSLMTEMPWRPCGLSLPQPVSKLPRMHRLS